MKNRTYENKELWAKDRLLNNLRYPDESVVKFLFYLKNNFNVEGGPRILDFGCGSGRNTVVMGDLGFDIYAMDYNADCIELTKEKMNNYKKILYVENQETVIPAEDEFFDAIVAWGALFYLNRVSEHRLMIELARTLKSGGVLQADYRAKDDLLYGRGKEVEQDMFILDNTCGSLSGISYAFRDLEEIESLYKSVGLKIFNYEKIEHYVNRQGEKTVTI